MGFYERLTDYYEEVFPLREGKVSFVRSFLDKPASRVSRVLDIGCAVGQLSNLLAGEGHVVTGIDLDAGMVKRAEADAAADFAAMDMMEVDRRFSVHSFDMVLCLGNTLVHLHSLEEMGIFIKKIFNLLKEGGVFILQVVNYDAVLGRGIKALPVIDVEHVRFERGYEYDEVGHRVRFRSNLTVKDSGEVVKSEVLLYPLTRGELESLMVGAGFRDVEYFGNFQKVPHSIDSPALIAAGRAS
ncbi:MAG: class I SAM-dependent methyltransferase [bacterium]|nr:class I SAM-dependent methyltransferase [bacterium]